MYSSRLKGLVMRKLLLVLALGVYCLVGCSPGLIPLPLMSGVYCLVGFNDAGEIRTKKYKFVDEASCEKFRNKIPRPHGPGLQSMLEIDGNTSLYPIERTRCVPAY